MATAVRRPDDGPFRRTGGIGGELGRRKGTIHRHGDAHWSILRSDANQETHPAVPANGWQENQSLPQRYQENVPELLDFFEQFLPKIPQLLGRI